MQPARQRSHHLLELVEGIMGAKNWHVEQCNPNQVIVDIPCQWCELGLVFSVSHELGIVHVSCMFNMSVPENKLSRVYHLLALANEKLWLGHFTMMDNSPVFRYSILTESMKEMHNVSAQEVIDIIIEECSRFFPAFQYVIWGDKKPQEAMDAALLDPAGEA